MRRSVRTRSFDADILRLALPALGALAAEPLYLLVDTAIVGHLGTPQLAALALAATVLSNLVALCIFLTYGTTARVTRLHGAGEDQEAAALGPQALWLALAAGVVVAAAVVALAEPLVHALGGKGVVAEMAVHYLRIASLGVPMALAALAGQGWLRGVGDLRTPLVIVVAANAVNVVLELLFVYGLDWGLSGSAWGTVLAQLGMGCAFAVVLLRVFARPDLARIRSLISIGAQLVVRTAALLACFVLSIAVCARIGAATVAAHQIAFQLYGFLALLLDAIVMWPVAAIAFALDGILIGAGDTAYMALAMVVSFAVFAPIVLAADTVAVVWVAIDVLMLVRVATLGARFARRRWALVGAYT